ncbi:hypothetical protein ABW19_dt0205155 [Dactylella cylindrospora]|nr:hypothetical protein ABW19_dt0205155 [Dactylella cylindrospora]
MPPQFSHTPHRYFQRHPGSRIHPYATNQVRYAEYVPPYITMTGQRNVVANETGEGSSEGNGKSKGKKQWRKRNRQKKIDNHQQNLSNNNFGGHSQGEQSATQSGDVQAIQNAWEALQDSPSPMPSEHVGNPALEPQNLEGYLGQQGIYNNEATAYISSQSSLTPISGIQNPLFPGPSPVYQQWDYQSLMGFGYGLPSILPTLPYNNPLDQRRHFSKSSKPQQETATTSTDSQTQGGNNVELNTHPAPVSVDEEFSNLRISETSGSPGQPDNVRYADGSWYVKSKVRYPRPKQQKVQFKRRDSRPQQSPEAPETTRLLEDMGFIEAKDIQGIENGKIMLTPPEPSVKYLDIAGKETWLVPNPRERKLLVILDLNGTLLFRPIAYSGGKDNKNPIHRPQLREFLEYIFRQHHVVIFSSATRTSVATLLRNTIPRELRNQILRIFTREDIGIPRKYFFQKVSTFKRLTMVWKVLAKQNAAWRFSQVNTVLIDDSQEKAASEPFNHVTVPDFTEKMALRGDDAALVKVASYLEDVRAWANVSSFIRQHPFKVEDERKPPASWGVPLDSNTAL